MSTIATINSMKKEIGGVMGAQLGGHLTLMCEIRDDLVESPLCSLKEE